MKYNTREVTPKSMRCGLSGCPAIYETKDVTPEHMRCIVGACPTVHQTSDSYLIVGRKVNPEDAGLAGKVGEGEVLIKVPKALIDQKER